MRPFTEQQVGAGGIIVNVPTCELLVVKGPLKWSLPKGHFQDEKESFLECAKREIKEETNLNVALDASHRFVNIGKYRFFLILVFDRPSVSIQDTKEIQRVEWIPLDKVHTLDCNHSLFVTGKKWRSFLRYEEPARKSKKTIRTPSLPDTATVYGPMYLVY